MREVYREDVEWINRMAEKVLDKSVESYSRLGGMNNHSYRVTLSNGAQYVFRIPGKGTNALIDRKNERYYATLANSAGLDAPFYYFDDEGYKISQYLKDAETLSPETMKRRDNLEKVGEVFRKLHASSSSDSSGGSIFDVFERAAEYEQFLYSHNVVLYDDYETVKREVFRIHEQFPIDSRCPCHNDPLCENWVLSCGQLYLIDYEYGGENDGLWDLADVSIEAGLDNQQDEILLKSYYQRPVTDGEYSRFLANKLFIDYLWTLWGLSRVPFDGESLQQYADARYHRLCENLKLFLSRKTDICFA